MVSLAIVYLITVSYNDADTLLLSYVIFHSIKPHPLHHMTLHDIIACGAFVWPVQFTIKAADTSVHLISGFADTSYQGKNLV